MSTIQIESLSLMVCEIFPKLAPLTLNLGPRSKVMAPNESPYMISYMSIIQVESLTLMVCEILPKIAVWPLTLDQGQRSILPICDPYPTRIPNMDPLAVTVHKIKQRRRRRRRRITIHRPAGFAAGNKQYSRQDTALRGTSINVNLTRKFMWGFYILTSTGKEI